MSEKVKAAFAPQCICYFLLILWIYLERSSLSFTGSGVYGSTQRNVSLVLVLIFIAACQWLGTFLMTKPCIIGASVLCAAGTGLLILSHADVASGFFQSAQCLQVAATCTAVGLQSLLFMTFILFASRDNDALGVVGSFFAGLGLAAVVSVFPLVAFGTVFLLAPLASGFVILRNRTLDKSSERTEMEDLRHQIPVFVKFGIYVVLLTSAIIVAQNVYRDVSDAGSPLLRMTVVLVSIAAMVAVIALSSISYKRFTVVSLHRAVFLFYIVFLVLAAMPSISYEIAYSITFVAGISSRALMFIVCYKICAKSALSPVLVLGVVELVRRIPPSLGHLSWSEFSNSVATIEQSYPIFLVLIVLIVSAYVLLFTEKDAWIITEVKHSLSEEEIIERKCLRFAEKHSLSSRETDVLVKLRYGRSVPRIAQELYLSPGTINVYMRKIYQKVDVHSKQELLDKFEVEA